MGDSINILDEEFIKSLQTIEDIHKTERFTIYKVSKPDGTIYALKVLKIDYIGKYFFLIKIFIN